MRQKKKENEEREMETGSSIAESDNCRSCELERTKKERGGGGNFPGFPDAVRRTRSTWMFIPGLKA